MDDECLVAFEADLGACDALDGQQCRPHWFNTALSRHALNRQCDRRRFCLRVDGARED